MCGPRAPICFSLLWRSGYWPKGFIKNHPGRFFYGGLVVGFAYLVRPEAVGLLVVIPGFLVFRRIVQKERSWTVISKCSALLLTGFLLFALPYIVYLSIDTGQWGALSRKAGVTLAINLEKSRVLDADGDGGSAEAEASDFFQLIRRYPLQYAMNVLTDLPLAAGAFFEALHFSYVPFLLIGSYASVCSSDGSNTPTGGYSTAPIFAFTRGRTLRT